MSTTRRKYKLFMTTALSLGVICFAQPVFSEEKKDVFSLTDALKVGVTTNPQYGAAVEARKATDENLKQGEALFRPSVDVNSDAGLEHNDNVSTRARGKDENLFRKQIGLTLTQMLFDGWGSHYEVERQKARVESAASRVRETSELVGLSIIEAYLDVLRQRQLLLIARQNISEHSTILGQIKDGVSAGRSTQADAEQVNARLAAARTNEINTAQALRNAESEYKRVVGEVAGELEMPKIPLEALEQDLEKEVEATLLQSPTLDVFSADVDAASAQTEGTKSAFYPQLDMRLNTRAGHDEGGIHGRDTSAAALVVMNWNLYRGGADVSRVREFGHRHQQSKEAYDDAYRSLENDVRQTWASMIAARERSVQLVSQVSANTKVISAYKDQFSLDRRTLLDVLDSQNELFVTRSNVVNAEFLEMFAVYRLLALKGNLLPTMGVEYPREEAVATKAISPDPEKQNLQ